MENEMNNQSSPDTQPAFFWKREITYGQFVGFLIAILGAFGAYCWEQNTRITEYGIRITTLEKAQSEIPGAIKEIANEVKSIAKDQNEYNTKVLIELQNKKDR